MRIATGLAFAALMLGACGGEAPAPAAPAEPVAEAPAPAPEVLGPNTLSAEQTAQGWKLLFNGVDLAGWKGYKKDKPGDAWKAKVAASKFKQWPLFGTFAKGHIALQDHGDKVWYRNIKVRAV